MENKKGHHETKVLKGSDVLEKLCEECLFLGDKVLIVFSEDTIKQSGLYARVISLLNICGIEHITYECADFSDFERRQKEAVELGKKKQVSFILAIGDEPLMAFAKAIAYNYYAAGKEIKYLPIINIASGLRSDKSTVNVPHTPHYNDDIKPVALFLDYEF